MHDPAWKGGLVICLGAISQRETIGGLSHDLADELC